MATRPITFRLLRFTNTVTMNNEEKIMSNKNNKNDDFMLGDILLPVMELMTLIIMALMDLATKGIMWGGNKALDKVFNREAPLIKIERDDLKVSKSTLKDD